MGSLGFSVGSRNFTYFRGQRNENVITDISTMPVDGWLVRCEVHAGGWGQSIRARIGIWDTGDGDLIYSQSQQRWANGVRTHIAHLPDIRMRRGQNFHRGYWRHPDDFSSFSIFRGSGEFHLLTNLGSRIAERVRSFVNYRLETLVGRTEYVANRRPLKPRWTDPYPEGNIDDLNPVFSATIPHDAREGGRDHTEVVQVQIRNTDQGTVSYNRSFTTTQRERNLGRWSRRLFSHEAGRSYRARTRHRDSFGLWSVWSEWTPYTASRGPSRPRNLRPAGEKVDTREPRLSGNYFHPEEVRIDSLRVQILSENRTVLQDSGWKSTSGESFDATFEDLGFESLPWGVRRLWRARVRDVNGLTSDWSPLAAFRTNSAPRSPSDLRPSDGDFTARANLSARVRDPDGDDLQWVRFEIYDDTNDEHVHTAFQVDGPFPSGSVVTHDFSGDLTLGRAYRWRAWTFDGTLVSERSSWEEFVFDEVPVVEWVSPQRRRTNLARQPRAVYDPVSTGVEEAWQYVGVNGDTRTIERTDDGDAPVGSEGWCWIARNANDDTGYRTQSERRPVDPSLPGYLTAWMRVESGEPSVFFRLECYDSAGERTGSVYPGAGVILRGETPEPVWTRYGGLIRPEDWPEGTAEAEIRLFPNAGGNAALDSELRFDRFTWHLGLPLGAGLASDRWYRYFDGNYEGYGEEDTYFWTGREGESVSVGIPVLDSPASEATATISYEANAPKARDRLFIERWTGSDYKRVWDTGLVDDDPERTVFGLPAGVVQNEGHYRMAIFAEDVNGQVSNTGLLRFDVYYLGPPELFVTNIAASESRAELAIEWTESDLGPLEFVRYEVVLDDGFEEILVAEIAKPEESELIYPYPVSGREYEVRVRQVAVVGPEEMESEWRGGVETVEYADWHLKDLEDPEDLSIAFPAWAEDEFTTDHQADTQGFRPRGSTLPVYYPGERRQQVGSVTVRIMEGLEARDTAERLLALHEKRRGAVLLSPDGRKRFVDLGNPREQESDLPWHRVFEVSFEETDYIEDVRERRELDEV